MISQIVLIGLPGSGKTSTAAVLAEQLSLPLREIDAEIEESTGKKITEIFEQDGEPAFRKLEVETTLAALAGPGIFSLGGGAVTNPEIREALKGRIVVWLRTTIHQAVNRLGNTQDRPLLASNPAARLLELSLIRSPLYAECATHVVDTDSLRPKEVAATILEELEMDQSAVAPAIIPVAGERPYNVEIGHGVHRHIISLLEGVTRVGVIHTSAVLNQACSVVQSLAGTDVTVLDIAVPIGEDGKTVSVLADCWEQLATAGFTRSDLIVGVGGGATTDLAGFVAATYLRGIDFVTVPTSLLAMVDASVGGKTGIDLQAGKNLVGSFHEPRAVLADLDFLQGLDAAEIRSGLAEVVKIGFTDDARILDLVESYPEAAQDVTSVVCAELIGRAIAVKARVVSLDLREATSVGDRVGRERLNYGHTYGHALEADSGYAMRHGEAVAIGTVFAAELAHRLGLIDASVLERHRSILRLLGLPVTHSQDHWPELRALMARDKKTRGDQLRFVVLDGHGVRIEPTSDDDLLQAIHRGLLTD